MKKRKKFTASLWRCYNRLLQIILLFMPLTITDCLLDENNPRIIDGITIGQRISAAGKIHLWNDRPPLAIDTLVIHYISAADHFPAIPFELDLVLKEFCDHRVSSHFLIERNGAILRLVPEVFRAWHCGGSSMPPPDGRRNVNDFSVGIELVATHDSGFTQEQYRSLVDLGKLLKTDITTIVQCVGHDEIAGPSSVLLGLRADIKRDPGPLFDWNRVRTAPDHRLFFSCLH